VVDSTATGFVESDAQNALGFPSDTINSALATSGPSAMNVYAPITNVAGRQFARIDTATLAGAATQSLVYGSVSNDITGTSRLVFANQIIVRKTVDTVTSAATTTINARWVLPSASPSAAGPGAPNFVARDQAFTANANIPVRNGTAFVAGTPRGTSGSARVFIDTIASPATHPGFVWVTGDNRPIFAINDRALETFPARIAAASRSLSCASASNHAGSLRIFCTHGRTTESTNAALGPTSAPAAAPEVIAPPVTPDGGPVTFGRPTAGSRTSPSVLKNV
jgi:hypothetical protein